MENNHLICPDGIDWIKQVVICKWLIIKCIDNNLNSRKFRRDDREKAQF